MTQQFLRACSLVVGDASGVGLDLAALRVTFSITHGTTETPRMLAARVYNPAPNTVSRIQSEFTNVALSAGYQGNIATIFTGTIAQVRYGRENAADTFVDIFATTGDKAYAYATTSFVIAQGWTHSDIQSQCAQDMVADNIAAGVFPEISGSGARPKVLYGMTRDICRVTAASTSSVWGINGSSLDFRKISDLSNQDSASSSVVLSPKTGLIGIPLQTIDGVQATSLLNPQIKKDSIVNIASKYILGAQADLSYSGLNGGNQIATTASGVSRQSVDGISPSGLYRVVFAEHEGDTRGDAWYTHIACIAVDVSTVTSSGTNNSVD